MTMGPYFSFSNYRVYWVDEYSSSLESSDFNGGNKRSLPIKGSGLQQLKPIGVDIYDVRT